MDDNRKYADAPQNLNSVVPWVSVHAKKSCLDGEFTAEHLRAIADEMDRLLETS